MQAGWFVQNLSYISYHIIAVVSDSYRSDAIVIYNTISVFDFYFDFCIEGKSEDFIPRLKLQYIALVDPV